MSETPKSRFDDPAVARQPFLSPFLRSEREIVRYVSVLFPNVTGAKNIAQQTAMAVSEKFVYGIPIRKLVIY